ncbi:MAG: tetratricopeptide repeat protein [Treponema sp.]|nr:tetratricopeptide repeat protein [Treponema sp.]
MKKVMKIIFCFAYALGLIFFIGLLLYRRFVNKGLFPSLDDRHAITLCVAFTVAFIKLLTRSSCVKGRSLGYYKNFYKDIIKDSFEDNKKLLKKFLQAVSLYNVNKYQKSILHLNSILPECRRMNEKYCVKLFLALNYSDSGDSDSAMKMYEDMIDEYIADSTVFSNLMLLYKDKGDFEKADEIGKKAISYDPQNYIAYNNLASSSFHKGDYDQAAEYAKKCLEIQNDFLPSIKLLFIIYSLNEDSEQAGFYEKKAIANGVSKKDLQAALDCFLGESE